VQRGNLRLSMSGCAGEGIPGRFSIAVKAENETPRRIISGEAFHSIIQR
jgi:hypothetical protein